MSVQAMVWVLEHSEASGNDRCVLFSIANHAHSDGTGAYPSQETIAHEARCSVETVRRSIRRLERAGEILVEPNEGIGARRKTNLYTIPGLAEPVTLRGSEPGKSRGSPVDNSPRTGQSELRTPQTEAQNRSPVTYEPSLNRPIEPNFCRSVDRTRDPHRLSELLDPAWSALRGEGA